MKTTLTVGLARKLGYKLERGSLSYLSNRWYAYPENSALDHRGPGNSTRKAAIAELVLDQFDFLKGTPVGPRADLIYPLLTRQVVEEARALLWLGPGRRLRTGF